MYLLLESKDVGIYFREIYGNADRLSAYVITYILYKTNRLPEELKSYIEDLLSNGKPLYEAIYYVLDDAQYWCTGDEKLYLAYRSYSTGQKVTYEVPNTKCSSHQLGGIWEIEIEK